MKRKTVHRKAAPPKKLWLTFLVNGVEIRAEVADDGPIGGAVDFASMRAGLPIVDALGFPPIVRDFSGRVLLTDRSNPREMDLKDGAVLSLDWRTPGARL